MKRVLRRPALWAAALYAVLAVVFVSPALFPDRTLSPSDYLYAVPPWKVAAPSGVGGLGTNFELLDQSLQFEPFQRYARDEGGVPLWNPHVMAGRPFHADAQSAMFSPFSLPSRAMPVSDALAWAAVLKLFVAAFGGYLLARALRLRFAAALVAGLIYAFGLFIVAWLAWSLASVWVWLPWLLALTELTVRRPGPLPAAGLAVVTALQFFGGHPESSFHVVFATLAFFALRLLVRRRELSGGGEKPLWRPLAAFAGGLAGGLLLAAIALVPLAELILHSGELEERTQADPDKVRWTFLATMLLPDFFGRPTQTPLVTFINLRAFYVGALPVMLAVAAVVMRPTLERIAVAAFGVGALGVVVGVPPIHQIVNALPGFSSTHNGRLTLYWLLAATILAAYALDDLLAKHGPPRRQWVAWIAIAVACAPLAWLAVGRPDPSDLGPALETAWGFVHPPNDADVIRLASLLVWIPFAAVAAVLVWLRVNHRLSATAFGAAAVMLVAADLFRIGMGLNPAIDEETARVPVTPAIEYLQSRRPARFVGATAFGTLPPLEPNLAMDFDLYDARGYDFPTEERYSRLWEEAVYPDEGFVISEMQAPINPRSLRALSVLSVADVMASREVPRPRGPGLELAYDGEDARVYSNANALPRTFVVGGTRVVPGEEEQLDALLAPEFNGRREAIVEKPLAGLDRPGPAGAARIVDYESDRVTVEANAKRRALLVLTDVHFPGWKAELDGEEVPIERVDYLLRGVRVPAGAHTVEFRYEPMSWRIGWITSLVALVVLLGLLVFSTASRRTEGAAQARP